MPMDDEELEAKEQQQEIEKRRREIANKIAVESESLIDALFELARNADDDKVRLSAISMLLDRGIPKLGVEHTKEESDEAGSQKALRDEIERLLLEDRNDDDEGGAGVRVPA